MGIEEFIQNNDPQKRSGRKSKMLPYLDNILRLRNLGFSQKQICMYLETEEGVKVTQAALSQFLAIHADDPSSEETSEAPTKEK
jgi:DNA-binding transcriptional MerR regulator